jgi:hypothetical protein
MSSTTKPIATPDPPGKASPKAASKATEDRLDEIRRLAADSTKSKNLTTDTSYYGLPVLKPPTWTWEVPLYFFLGGIAGVAACIAFVAQLFHGRPSNDNFQLIRWCLWMGLLGAAICPILLISDLGKPSRFLNMLRVFKLRSPMSMGAWILVAFSGCAFLGVLGIELLAHGFANPFSLSILWLGEVSGAIMGLLLASYTAVLIGATAIPVWSQNRALLPPHFLASGLGGAGAILELAGFLIPVTQVIGFVASGIETLLDIFLEFRRRPVDKPLHHGWPGQALRIAALLEGPAALLLRVFWGSSPTGRYAAAICFLAGSLLSRYAWIWVGHASSRDPHALFDLQHKTR